jgi:hypothetical protein
MSLQMDMRRANDEAEEDRKEAAKMSVKHEVLAEAKAAIARFDAYRRDTMLAGGDVDELFAVAVHLWAALGSTTALFEIRVQDEDRADQQYGLADA